jgi:uncharacterized membrane protein YidH (DUF202 family)
MRTRRRLITSLRTSIALLGATLLVELVGAPSALADFGRGVYGETSDRVVTYAGLSMIVFFPLFIFVMSRIQYYLERRKERKKVHLHAGLGNGRTLGGW